MRYLKLLVKLIKTSPFIRHNTVFFLGSMVTAALNYFYYPVLGRMLPPADFGEVQALTSLFTQTAIFLSILTYVTIYVTVNAKDDEERTRTILALEHVALITGGILLGLTLLSVNVLRHFLQFSSTWPFIALIAALGFSVPLMVRMSYLRGIKNFFRATMTDGIGSAAKLVLSPVLVLAGLKSFGAMLGLALSQIISLAFGTFWVYREGLRGFGFRRRKGELKSLRPQLHYAWAVFLVSLSATALLSLDMLAVKHYFSPDDAGLYAGMTTVARIVFFVTAPFTGVLLTMVSTKHSKKRNVLWLLGSLVLICTVGLAAVLVLTMFPDFIIKVLVGSKYLAYADLLPRLSLAMLILGIANTMYMYHVALRRYIFGWAAILVTIFTVLLLGMRHNTPGQVVQDILVGSTALLVLAVLLGYINKLLRSHEHGEAGAANLYHRADV